MILCDVNVLLHALVARSPRHNVCRKEVERARAASEPFAVSELILSAVLRIATNPRVFKPAPAPDAVFPFLEALRAGKNSVVIAPQKRHWQIFRQLVEATEIRGPDTSDAYFAALALEHGCEWWTTDIGFSRFSGLSWRHLA